MSHRGPRPPKTELSPRETQVAEYLLKGASNEAISLELDRSIKTVEFHVSNILRKTGTASRLDLVVKTLTRRRG